ncbi:MAG TPA: zinc-dependent alcohol dehydrogenase family protein [Parachlamydiaceae bacterium]|nr:zinc-dependent alcohol dehydrogenase family protein [Parachlamydiaceae bacterium]
MKALVYQGPGKIGLENKPKPVIENPTDCIVRITTTTICGTDLHIWKGDIPEVERGRTLGHEGVGVIEAVGSAVSNFQVNDKVLISCITSCGTCSFCKDKMYSQCIKGGWMLGHKIDGTQAEYVRIPYADTSLYPIPGNMDEEAAVMFSDILPTGYEAGVLKGQIKLGDTVAIIGAGPIGLSTLLTAQFYSPEKIFIVDRDEYRLEVAKRFGATHVINDVDNSAVSAILKMTQQKGVDVAIEAVGTPDAFETCQAIIAPGGHIANIGVHGKSVSLHLEKLWNKNITLTTALVDTFSTPLLLKMCTGGRLNPSELITHHFALEELAQAYEVFRNSIEEHSLKVIIKNRYEKS